MITDHADFNELIQWAQRQMLIYPELNMDDVRDQANTIAMKNPSAYVYQNRDTDEQNRWCHVIALESALCGFGLAMGWNFVP